MRKRNGIDERVLSSRARATSRRGWLAAELALLTLALPAHAATVKARGEEAHEAVTVVAEKMALGKILQDLAHKYRFKINGIENVGAAETASAKMTGSVSAIVGRLLRNRNYLIVRSPDNASGIESIMILDAKYGAGPAKYAPANRSEDPMLAIEGGAQIP